MYFASSLQPRWGYLKMKRLRDMKMTKKYRLAWVVVLVISSFTLGYYVRPKMTNRPMGMGRMGQPLGMPMGMPPGQMRMPRQR